MRKSIYVVLVDKNDKRLSLKEKYATHRVPVPLHRAISIVLFNKDKSQTLITKRSAKKPTWPYYWSNSVCSHPYPNETYQKAAERRLYEELGIKTPLKKRFHFTYSSEMDNKIWGEHEYDMVFTGLYDKALHANPDEIAGYEWIGISNLKRDIRNNPKKYTPWFKILLKRLEI
jgi:isopentenyl-diphosphate delta-isomerase